MQHTQDIQTSGERLEEELATIRRARNAWPDNSQFALLCNRTMERLREYVDVMDRTQARHRNHAFSGWAK